MEQLNRYYHCSKISDRKTRQIIRCFALDLTAAKAAEIVGLTRKSVNQIYLKIRRRVAEDAERASPFGGIVEVDESYFGARRVRGRRGRGASGKGHANLKSIKGIGSYSAAVLLSVSGDVNDFPDEDKLASYFGIVPRVSNSNQTQHHGSITKRGSKLARTALIQCTLTAKRFSPYLKQFYERIKARRGAAKEIIATARKFLGIIYRTLKYSWVFSDFPNFVLAEQ